MSENTEGVKFDVGGPGPQMSAEDVRRIKAEAMKELRREFAVTSDDDEDEAPTKKKKKVKGKRAARIFGVPVANISEEAREFYADVATETGHHRLAAELSGKDYKKGIGAKLKRGMNKTWKVKHTLGVALAGGVVATLTHRTIANKMGWDGLWGEAGK